MPESIQASQPARYRFIEVRPVAGALGAEVRGIDLASAGEEAMREVHTAFLRYQVLCFRDQSLTVEQHKTFARRFGPLFVHPYVKPLPGHPEVMQIVKEPEDRENFGGRWHADLTYLPEPMLGAALYAVEVPAHGGDTLFASMYAALESLSPGLRELLGRLSAVHDDRASGLFQTHRIRAMGMRDIPRDERGAPIGSRSVHPVLRTHPETGRDALFVNSISTIAFDGMSEEESRPLLAYLFDHLQRPEFTCRLRWEPGSLVLWDNRCTQHLALNDYHGQRRVMRRVLIAGDRPRLKR